MLENTLSIILAGGVGSRLHPLTADRAKPGVPFGGKYRIIDFTLSNCLHSGLRRVLVLTQYKSHSLQKHLRDGWSIFNPELREYITMVPPQMRKGDSWYVGTADAIYQNLYLLERSGAEHVLILSGDHIYRMDYQAMLQSHIEHGADCTVGGMEVPLQEASAFGVITVDREQRIIDFLEKPENPVPMPGDPKSALVSMGIYVFSLPLLCSLLEADHESAESSHDFGKDILPKLLHTHQVFAYRFGGQAGRVTCDRYWRDVGTIDAFFEAHMDLLQPQPPINLYQKDWSIRTYEPQGPPARMIPGPSGKQGELMNSMLTSGNVIEGANVRHSILSPNVRIGEGAEVERCILFEGVTVGPDAVLKNCIIDKHVKVPAGARIGCDPVLDAKRFTISERGVTVVPKMYQFTS
ncbi:MAG: glgC [Planctomycetaceae bacterium]|nr:glgC [Planctomycetaceae bacterium]